MRAALLLLIPMLLSIGAFAMFTVAPIFSDNMVLQRDMKVPVWGQASPGDVVTVTVGAQRVTAKVDVHGAWMVRLQPMQAATSLTLTVSAAGASNTFNNVAVGEVWLCTGQSNMQFGLSSAANAKEAIAGANYPMLRYSKGSAWIISSPETASGFSAIGYFYGRELQKSLKVPVGIICNALGGTPAESWMSSKGLRLDPYVREHVMNYWDKLVAQFPKEKAVWEAKLIKEGKNPVEEVFTPEFVYNPPSLLYFQRMKAIIPYGMRGVAWYQGESNAWCYPLAEQYYHLLPALVRDWRRLWGQGNFPFLIIQLPDIELGYHAFWNGRLSPYPELSQWNLIQEAEEQAVKSVPNTGLVVTLDLGDKHDIHPTRKEEVGQRMNLLARKLVYHEKLEASGPVYAGMKVEGKTIRLRFTHAEGGLVTNDGGPVVGFGIAGDDQLFLEAQAKIDGDSIVVWNDLIQKPLAARYAFFNHNDFNLYNKAGLPAGPFRTDNWPWNLPAKAPRLVKCVRAQTPPVLDGSLDDALWAQCPPAGQFTLPYTYHTSNYPTTVRFAYDAEQLYVSYLCTDPNMAGLVANVTTQDDENIWQDDIVEFFLDTHHDKRNFLRYIVNANGTYLDAKGYSNSVDGVSYIVQAPPIPARDFDIKWQGPMTVKTQRQAQGWTVEMAIPWTSLGVEAPKPGTTMGVQMQRTHAVPTEESEFITTGRDRLSGTVLPICKYYAVPERFAELRFE